MLSSGMPNPTFQKDVLFGMVVQTVIAEKIEFLKCYYTFGEYHFVFSLEKAFVLLCFFTSLINICFLGN